jgi:CHAT domain-containing protein
MSISTDILRAKSARDLERLAIGSFDSDPAELLGAASAEVNRLLRTDLRAARNLVTHLLRFEDFWGQQNQPLLIAMRARVALWGGQYRQAIADYNHALRLHERARDSASAARVRMALIEAHLYCGQYREAVTAGKKALNYFRRSGQEMQAARAMTNLGNVFHRMDQNRRALSWYEKAREIFVREGGIPLAIVDYNRGNIYANLNELSKARKLYLAAARVYDRAGMEIAENQAVYSVAYLAFLESRYTEALQLFEKVSTAFEQLGDTRSALIASMDIVEMDIQLNQYGSAVMLGESIIPRFNELGMVYEEARTTYFVALARLKLGDHVSARRRLDHARRLFEREDNKLWLGMVTLADSELQRQMKRLGQALQLARKAEKLFVASRDLRRQIDAELVRLDLLYRNDNLSQAVRLNNRLRRRRLAAYQRYEMNRIFGDHFYRHHDYRRAREAYRLAVDAVENMLRGLYPDEVGFFFAADKYECYARLVSCQRRLGRVQQSLVTNLRALSLINRRVVPERQLRQEVPAGMLERMNQLRASLHRSYQSPRPGERSLELVSSYSSREQQLWNLERQARLHLYSQQPAHAAVTPKTGSLLPRSEETLVTFFEDDQSIGAYLFDDGATRYVDLELPSRELTGLIRKLHFLLERSVAATTQDSNPQACEAYLEELWRRLFAPLVPCVAHGTLRVVLTGPVSQLPIIALGGSSTGWLKDRYRVRLVADPAQRAADAESTHRPFNRAANAVLAVPSPTLPMVDEEAAAIGAAFPGSTGDIGLPVTRERLAQALESCDGFVHIATHASRSSENPVFSRLLMSDGPFFLFDLFGTGIKARLVTLSGCQTAAPGLYYGNSLSLARAFQQAGARYVLASLWQVSDRVAMTFMTAFYQHLKDSDNVSESYYYAVNYLQRLTSNPAHWGGFVLLED